MGVYPKPEEDGAIGEVIGSQWEGMRHREIGNCQGWYYKEDDVLILWECYLHEPYRYINPLEDRLLRLIWERFEGFLLRLSGAHQLYTPSWEPIYEDSLWQEFLTSLGYQKSNKMSFMKGGNDKKPPAVLR